MFQSNEIRRTHLFDGKVEAMLQVRALVQHQHVEVPRPTEVGHHNRVHRPRAHNVRPRCGRDGRHRLLHRFAQRLFDVLEFVHVDGGMDARLLEHQPQPQRVPERVDFQSVGVGVRNGGIAGAGQFIEILNTTNILYLNR